MHFIFDRLVAQGVGGAVVKSSLHTASGQPDRERVRIVVTSFAFLRVARAAKLTAPNH